MGTRIATLWDQRVPDRGKKETQPGRQAGMMRSFRHQSHEGIAFWASRDPRKATQLCYESQCPPAMTVRKWPLSHTEQESRPQNMAAKGRPAEGKLEVLRKGLKPARHLSPALSS